MEDFFKDLTWGKFCGWLYLMGGRDETGMRWCGWRLYLTPILVLLYDIRHYSDQGTHSSWNSHFISNILSSDYLRVQEYEHECTDRIFHRVYVALTC